MTELRRLFDAQPDEFAIDLLRSAEDDAPGARSLAQTAAALGVSALLAGAATVTATPVAAAASVAGAFSSAPTVTGLAAAPAALGVAAAPAATSTAAAITFAVLAKHAAVGMVAGLAVMGGFYSAVGVSERASASSVAEGTVESAPETAPAVRRTAANDGLRRAPSVPAPPALDSTPTAQFPLLPGEATPSQAKSVERARVTGSRPVTSAAKPAPAAKTHPATAEEGEAATAVIPAASPPKNASLSREVELLDRARSALAAGNATSSLDVLDQYEAAKPSAVLAPEAQVLRIQVLDRLGQAAAASALAKDFVARHPGSRHAAALRPLAERADVRP